MHESSSQIDTDTAKRLRDIYIRGRMDAMPTLLCLVFGGAGLLKDCLREVTGIGTGFVIDWQ